MFDVSQKLTLALY